MLMLTRYIGQSIILTLPNAETIEVKFARFNDGEAKIGIRAPDNIHILRAELSGQSAKKNSDHMKKLSDKKQTKK